MNLDVMKDTSNSNTLNRSSSSISKFSEEMIVFEEMGHSFRRVFSLLNRNVCDLEPREGMCGFH
jgi:hypothetical protein